MTERDPRRIPEWAKRERASDFAWIGENLHVFWPAARKGYVELGRGAIVVDTTSQPTGAGNPMAYLPESEIEQQNDPDALRMVHAYDPSWEFVTMLLKQQDPVSTYRIGIPSARESKPPKA
jgi:hypothetical protein